MNDKKSAEELHNYVRLALPLMSKHNVPVTPRNYAVWYEYVSGSNNELCSTIDTMLEKEFEQAKTAATVDFLTGVANRKAFDETLAKCISEASSDHNDLCLLMIDIDHFKRFNDEYGHIVGDEVLKFVTKKTKEIVRGRDFLARFGGEEFVVILPQTPLSGAKTVAENIRAFFAEAKLTAVATSKKLGKVTVSIGAALYRPGEPLETFINRSDQALYFAKDSGRNRVATESDVADGNAGG